MYKFIISWKRVVNSLRVSNVSLTVDATKYFTGYVSNSKSFPVVRTKVRGAVTWAGSVDAVVFISCRCCSHCCCCCVCFGMFIALSTTMHENF